MNNNQSPKTNKEKEPLLTPEQIADRFRTILILDAQRSIAIKKLYGPDYVCWWRQGDKSGPNKHMFVCLLLSKDNKFSNASGTMEELDKLSHNVGMDEVCEYLRHKKLR